MMFYVAASRIPGRMKEWTDASYENTGGQSLRCLGKVMKEERNLEERDGKTSYHKVTPKRMEGGTGAAYRNTGG